jgi:1,4-alpha-glucan branching enzyme
LEVFAAAHEYYGLHRTPEGWVIREWAPMAKAIHLLGDCNGWEQRADYTLRRINAQGDWELHLPAGALAHGQHFKFVIEWEGGRGDRIPAYARRVVQDPASLIFQRPGLATGRAVCVAACLTAKAGFLLDL